MRKFVFGAIAVAVVAHPAEAQLTGGGAFGGPQGAVVEEPAREGPFGNRSAIRGGPISATGTYGELPDQVGFVYFTSDALESAFSTGSGATSGFYVELARLNHIATVHPMVGIGLELAGSLGIMDIDFAAIQDRDDVEDTMPEALLDARFGPVVTVNPVTSLFVDLSAKLGYGLTGGSQFYHYDLQVSRGNVSVYDYGNPSTGIARSLGLTVRFGAFQAGIESHAIGGARSRTYELTNPDGSIEELEYTTDVSASSSRLFFGLNF